MLKELLSYEKGFKVDSVAPVSTRIWQGFPLLLILVSPWLFKKITDNRLLENPLEYWVGDKYGHTQVEEFA